MSWTDSTQALELHASNFKDPASKSFVIEVPGQIIDDGSTVIKALGGHEQIRKSLTCPLRIPLILSLVPDDPLSKFISAKAYQCAAAFIRYRKFRSGRIEFKLEGLVHYKFVFQSLADYYLAPPRLIRFPRDVIYNLEKLKQVSRVTDSVAQKILKKCGVGTPHKLHTEQSDADEFLAPSVYTRQVTPFAYNYRDNVTVAGAKYFLTEGKPKEDIFSLGPVECVDEVNTPFIPRVRGHAGVVNAVARFGDAELPTKGVPNMTSLDAKLLKDVETFFNERPVWQRVALMASLGYHTTVWKLKPVLAVTCFLFLDGPWRGCLVRYGYDPRRDPSAMKYQCIDFRDPYFRSVRWRTQEAELTTKNTFNSREYPDYQFSKAPTRPSVFYQLCDIDDPVVRRMLNVTTPTTECSKESGWLGTENLGRIRDVLCARARKLRNSTEAPLALMP